MILDQHNLQITSNNIEAVEAYNQTILAYLSLSQDVGSLLKSIFKKDPNMVMGHCLRGYFFIIMGNATLWPRALDSFNEAKKLSKSATPREKAHVNALGEWCNHNEEGALKTWEDILRDYPNDILALRLAHHAHFYSGDAGAMCRSIENVFPKWSEEMVGFGFVLGMRAFSHEEDFNFDFAESLGRRAVKLNSCDPWSIHSVLHVMEMQDRHDEGIIWLESLEPKWAQSNNFRYHLWWHKALLHIDKFEFDKVLMLYDEKVWDQESDEYLDLCNDISLLIRMELCGIDVGQRWEDIGGKIVNRTDEHIRTFADVHFILALATLGNWEGVDNLIDTFSLKGGNVRIQLGIPLCRALVDYRKGNYLHAYKGMTALKQEIFKLGGSNAQRDLFSQIHIDSAIKSKCYKEAKGLLETRLKGAPKNNLTKQKLSEVTDYIDENF